MSDNDRSLEEMIAESMANKNSDKKDPSGSLAKGNAGAEAYGHDGQNSRRSAATQKKGKKKMSVKKKLLIAAGVVVSIFLILLAAVYVRLDHYVSLINTVPQDRKEEIVDSIPEDDDLVGDDVPDSPQEEIDDLEEQIRENLENNAIDFMQDEDVFNILLLGTDARNKTERGRSDSMILVSINKNTKEIVMTSFLRDIYLAIPGKESTRLNHSYAYGGANLTIETLEQNFKIKIDRYAQVNFFSFIDMVNAVGGVEINVTDAELPYLNNYLTEINRLEGEPDNAHKLSSSGTYVLNGSQALAYARIRYVGTDFARTERQRTVLSKIIDKTKALNLIELNDLLETILPQITTNMSHEELMSLVLNAPTYSKYNVKQCRVPADGTWNYMTIRRMSVIGINFEKNIQYLQDNIYGYGG